MAPQDKKPQPVTTLRCSSIKASIWKNEGVNGPFYNVTVARSYKGQDGVWKNSESFGLRGPGRARGGRPTGETLGH